MVQPAQPESWNHRNRLMNHQGTVLEPLRTQNVQISIQMEPEPGGAGTGHPRIVSISSPIQAISLETSCKQIISLK